MRRRTLLVWAGLVLVVFWPAAVRADIWDFDGESYEEPAGASFGVDINPVEEIYGGSFGWGLWLKRTPLFADYFLSLFAYGKEDAFYGALGLTLRWMPHTKVAPFVGAGGSYNAAASRRDDVEDGERDGEARGASYGAGHVEAGVRVWLASRVRLVEIRGRYLWTSLDDHRGYWLIGISTGTGF